MAAAKKSAKKSAKRRPAADVVEPTGFYVRLPVDKLIAVLPEPYASIARAIAAHGPAIVDTAQRIARTRK